MASFFEQATVLIAERAFGQGSALEQIKGDVEGWRHGAAEII